MAGRGTGERRAHRLGVDLAVLALVSVVVIAGLIAGYSAVYRALYSPSAFVTNYLHLLASGRAADALAVPGVTIDATELKNAGIDVNASDALLRPAALNALTDISVVSETASGTATAVTVTYLAGGHAGTTTFTVERSGWTGLAPGWRFARTPLAVVDVSVLGAMTFAVNGFTVDKRQVSADGPAADPAAAVPMLVFTPGLYAISVDTPVATTSGLAVLADAPLTEVPVDVQAEPTPKFIETVQERVDQFLAACTTQQVLQPTGCPFGLAVQNRIASLPIWSIVTSPVISVKPHGADWIIPSAGGVAHIEVEMRSLFDGAERERSEDVPFLISGVITMQPDGSASIALSSPDTE